MDPSYDDCDSEEEGLLETKRVAVGSRVNFGKLSENEKLARMQNMAKKIKKLKQKVRQLQS